MIIFDLLADFSPGHYASDHKFWQYEIIYGALFAVIATTSVSATLIIAYRIHSLTANSRSRRSYWYIIEITIQSVSVYSALMIGQAICIFVAPTNFEEYPSAYMVVIFLNSFGVISSVR